MFSVYQKHQTSAVVTCTTRKIIQKNLDGVSTTVHCTFSFFFISIFYSNFVVVVVVAFAAVDHCKGIQIAKDKLTPETAVKG